MNDERVQKGEADDRIDRPPLLLSGSHYLATTLAFHPGHYGQAPAGAFI